MERLLTVAEVADKLQVKASTIYAWVRQNKIPYIRVGRLIRFTTKQIEDFINHNGHLGSSEAGPRLSGEEQGCL
jgi:excisionase family DNA binding protein